MSFITTKSMGGKMRKGSPEMKAKMARLRAMRRGGTKYNQLHTDEIDTMHFMGTGTGGRERFTNMQFRGTGAMLVEEPMMNEERVGDYDYGMKDSSFMSDSPRMNKKKPVLNMRRKKGGVPVGGIEVGGYPVGGIEVGGIEVGGFGVGGMNVGGLKKGEKMSPEQLRKYRATLALRKEQLESGVIQKKPPTLKQRAQRRSALDDAIKGNKSHQNMMATIKRLLYPTKAQKDKYGEYKYGHATLLKVLQLLIVKRPEDPMIKYLKGGSIFSSIWDGIKKVGSTALDVGKTVAPFLPLVI